MDSKKYILIKGDEILATGTTEEIARKMGTKERTIYFYTTPCYKRALTRRTLIESAREMIPIDDEQLNEEIDNEEIEVIEETFLEDDNYEELELYPNTCKRYSLDEQNYIVEWYGKIDNLELALAIGRPPKNIIARIAKLRKAGLMPILEHKNSLRFYY